MQMSLKSKVSIFVMFAVMVLLMPRAFIKTSETKAMAIVTALGVDAVGTDIEVSAQIVIPKAQAGTTRSIVAVSAKNTDMASALQDISTYMGKKIGIEHCDVIVVGKKISENGVEDCLDYFFRGNRIEHNILIVFFDGEAKELIDSTSKIDNNFSLTIDEITKFSGEYFSTVETTLEKFYSEHYSPNKVSVIGGLKINDGEYGLSLSDTGESAKQESQGGGQSQGQEEKKNKFLLNEGEVAVFKDWKLAKIFSRKQTEQMNWLLKSAKRYSLRVDDVNDGLFEGASVIFDVKEKDVSFKSRFVGDTPVWDINITVDLKLENIIGGDKNKYKNFHKEFLTPMLRAKTIKTIINDVDEIVKVMKEEKLDVFRIYDLFEKTNYGKLKEYTQKYGREDFYQSLIYNVNVNLYERV